MKVIKLQVENIRKVKAAAIQPQENTVKISGKNASGKSSIIDSIWYALGGSRDIPDGVVHEGEKQARIDLDLDGVKVKRLIGADNKSTLKVWKDGLIVRSPQQLLNELLDKNTLDVTRFIRAEDDQRLDILLHALGLKEQLDELKAQHDTITMDRRDLGRDIKRKQGEIDAVRLDKDTPKEEIDVGALQARVTESQELEARRARQRQWITEYQTKGDEARAEVDRIEKEIKRLGLLAEKINQNAVKHLEAMEQAMDAYEQMPEAEDVNEITNQIVEANRRNQLFRDSVRHAEMLEELGGMERDYKSYTYQLRKIGAQKTKLLRPISAVVDGLEVDEFNAIRYKDKAFELASSAEQLYVSTAIATLNRPEIKVLSIKDGSLLDDESMAMLQRLSDEKDYQIWVEVVDDSGDVGFYIENGALS